MHLTALLTFLWLAATPLAAVAQAATVYHWVDAQGNVHYSQSPPPGVNTKAVRIEPPPAPVSSSPSERQNLEKFLHAQQAQQQQQAAAQAAQARKLARRQQRCTAARKHLQEFLATHTLLSQAAANASGDFGNDRLRARRTALQKQVSASCKSG